MLLLGKVSGILLMKDFVTSTSPAEPTGKTCSESYSKFIDFNKLIPICWAGNFHKFFSDMK